jgi:two-component system, NtrC family, C4-dicarboxylate transport response regulator DctD
VRPRVLLVEDDALVREALGQTLELGGYEAVLAASFIEARDHISADFPGVIVSDIRMPGKDGFALLAFCHEVDESLPVILLTGEGDIPTAVRGISAGAFDFLEKPCDPKHLLDVVEKASKTRELVLENRRLKRALDAAQREKIAFLGISEAAGQMREAIRRAGRSASPVLISGARGSGRGYVARLIQELRAPEQGLHRVDLFAPFSPEVLAGARGALLLCGIEKLPLPEQSRLLGALRKLPDCLFYATAGANIEVAVRAGDFDDDLYYHLGLTRIHVPALSERSEDIPILFEKFLREEIDAGAMIADAAGRAAAAGLGGLDWSGNLPALRAQAKRVAWGLADTTAAPGLKAQLDRVERSLIQDALRRHDGHATRAADALCLPRKTFYDRLQRFGIRPGDFRGG